MTIAKRNRSIDARVLTAQADVAAYLGKGVGWFASYRAKLEAHGFPKYDHLIAGWDKTSIDAWLDSRAGLVDRAVGGAEDLEGRLDRWAKNCPRSKNA